MTISRMLFVSSCIVLGGLLAVQGIMVGADGCEFPTVSINGGALITGSPDVVLSLCSPGAAEMMISNDGGFQQAVWEPYAESKPWTLRCEAGLCVVYAAFRDAGARLWGPVSDQIVFQPAGPSVSPTPSPFDTMPPTPTPLSQPTRTPTSTATRAWTGPPLPSVSHTPTFTSSPQIKPTATPSPTPVTISGYLPAQIWKPVQPSGEDALNDPGSITVHGGEVYLVDSGNHRIRVYDGQSWELLREWGGPGSGDGEFWFPQEALVQGGKVYVTDVGNHRIQVFTPAGAYLGQWGEYGDQPGQFNMPWALVGTEDGRVLVSDSANHRIQVFNAVGNFLEAWHGETFAIGSFSQPKGMAWWNDRLYVADSGNRRIVILAADGSVATELSASPGQGWFDEPQDVLGSGIGGFLYVLSRSRALWVFGAGGQLVATYGATGNESPGRFDRPRGLGIITQGQLVVVDSGNHRLQFLDLPFGEVQNWPADSSGGGFSFADKMSFGPDGYLYVTDPVSDTIQVLGPDGLLLRSWGASGSGVGQVHNLRDIAVGPDGVVYVVDDDNHRVLAFTSLGAYIRSWGGWGSLAGQFDRPTGVAVDPSGEVYVLDLGNERVQRFTSQGGYVGQWHVNRPVSIDAGPGGNIWVLDADEDVSLFSKEGERLRSWAVSGARRLAVAANGMGYVVTQAGKYWRITVYSFEGKGRFTFGPWLDTPHDLAISDLVHVSWGRSISLFRQNDLAYSHQWGQKGADAGQLDAPAGLVAGLGSLWIADSGNNRVAAFSSDGLFRAAWTARDLGACFGVAVAADGLVYALSTGHNTVLVFGPDGGLLRQMSAGLLAPRGIAMGPEGNLYVADTGNHRIVVMSPDGQILRTWGSQGGGARQFQIPLGIAVAQDGRVYVADTGNHRIQVYDSAGTLLGGWGSWGPASGQLDYPQGIAVGADGRVYVAERNNHRVQVFSSTGVSLGRLGRWGYGPGEFREPYGVAVDADGTVYVADSDNDRIQVFARPSLSLLAWMPLLLK